DPQPDGAEHRRPDDERDPAGGTLLVSGVVVAADVRRGGVPAVLGRSYGVGDRVPEAVPGRRPRLPEVLGVADVEMAAEIAGPLDGARGHIASLEPHALTEVAGALNPSPAVEGVGDSRFATGQNRRRRVLRRLGGLLGGGGRTSGRAGVGLRRAVDGGTYHPRDLAAVSRRHRHRHEGGDQQDDRSVLDEIRSPVTAGATEGRHWGINHVRGLKPEPNTTFITVGT